MYTMYANASNNTPYYTCVSSYMVWRVHPPGFKLSNCLLKVTTLQFVDGLKSKMTYALCDELQSAQPLLVGMFYARLFQI